MAAKRQNPIGPAIIIGLFLVMFVFLLVSRKGETGTPHPQGVTQNR